MKYKIAKEKREIEYFTTKVICNFCKVEFDKLTVDCRGYGKIKVSFGYSSKYDGLKYTFHICDACFEKHFKKFIMIAQTEYRNCPSCFSEDLSAVLLNEINQYKCSKCNFDWT